MPGFQQFTMGAAMTPQSKPIAGFWSKLDGLAISAVFTG